MRGIHSCCPESVSTVNINQTVLSIDSGEARFVEQVFTGNQFSDNAVTLDYAPFSLASTYLFLNSGSQLGGDNFSLQGKVLTLQFTPDTEDTVQVKYMARVDGMVWSDYPVGAMIGFSGSSVPAGWYLMNGVQEVVQVTHPVLHAHLADNLELTVEDTDQGADPYTLKAVAMTYFDPALNQLVQGQTIIKHD